MANTWKCCICEKSFTEQPDSFIFSMPVCAECKDTEQASKLHDEIYDAELPEHMHQERQWEAYRNDWPILDDPDDQAESNHWRREAEKNY